MHLQEPCLILIKSVYFAVWKSIDAKELWAQGVEIQDLAKTLIKIIYKLKFIRLQKVEYFLKK